MKLNRIIYLLLLSPILIFSQANNDISIGKIDSLDSKILKENRKLWIHVPDSDPNSIYIQQRYPVIVLLDGDSHFTSVVGMMQQLSETSFLPKMMVVGIPNTERTRDLTPTKPKPEPPFTDSSFVNSAGGSKQFRAFITDELIPYIDNKYPTQTHRVLIGHSLGGLYVMESFLEQPETFNSYISIDPSIWWDETYLLKKFKATDLAQKKYKDKSLYMGIANTLVKDFDTISVRQDTTQMTRHINAIFDINKLLKNKSHNNFKYSSKYYANDTHGSAPLITTYDALRFMYDYYNYDLPFEELLDGKMEIFNDIDEHYKNISLKLGYTLKPEEPFLNSMGYQFLSMEKPDVAKRFFEMNIKYYPESSNVYDSMGDYYIELDEKDKAISMFKKALELKENSYTREKLEKLQSD